MHGTTLVNFLNGVQVSSVTSLAKLSSGNVGLHKWTVPVGGPWWVDDVIARKYVNPEPTSGLGAEGAAP
jgi:hypothetical protein